MLRIRIFPVVLTGLTLSVTLALFGSDKSMAQPMVMVDGTCAAPGAGLISWWPGDDTYDDIAPPRDENVDPDPNPIFNAVRQDDSAVPSTTFEPGVVGNAFRFEGIDGQVGHFLEVPDAFDLRPASFTVELWAQRRGVGQKASDALGSMLVQKAVHDDQVATGMSYYVSWRDNGGQPEIVADVGFGGPASVPRLITAAPPMGVWVHVALTVENRTARLYVNGVLEDEFTGSSGVVYGDGSIVIGNNWYAARKPPMNFNRGFNGRIDELALFDGALTAAEVAQIHAAGSSGICDSAVQEIGLDVWPGRSPNGINLRNRGVVASAILGSADLDVSDVDRTTLRFGPAGARPAHRSNGHVMDVNRDGFADLVSHYRVRDSGLSSGDTEACVTGALLDGTEVQGCDVVTVRN